MVAEQPEFNREELEAWLRKQPPEVSVAIAARCALRSLPATYWAVDHPEFVNVVLLPAFHAIALSFASIAASTNAKQRLDDAAGFAINTATQASVGASEIDAGAAAATISAFAAVESSINTLDFAARASDAAQASDDAAFRYFNPNTTLVQDRQYIGSGRPIGGIREMPLWPGGQIPDEFYKLWENLKSQILSRGEDWDIWTQWYEDRLAGRPPEDEALAVARVTLPEPMWREGPKLVNAEIKNLAILSNKIGTRAVQDRMAELRELYPEEETENPNQVKGEDPLVELARIVHREKNQSVSNHDNSSQTTETSVAAQVRQVAGTMKAEDFDLPDSQNLIKSQETAASKTVQATSSDEEDEQETSSLPNVWILQFNPEDWEDAPEKIESGETLPWRTNKKLPKDLKIGDPVVYWRTRVQGGLVGTGHVLSREQGEFRYGDTYRFPTEVHEFDQSRLIPRKKVIEAAGITRKNWRGAVLPLSEEEALKIDDLLRREGRIPLFTDAQLEQARLTTREEQKETDETSATKSDKDTKEPLPEGEIRVRRDDAERDHDALGRGALAVSLATILHEIWCIEQGLKPYKARAPQKDAAGFVAHIDAPWGGGKTSFANLIARTLNPELDGPGTRPDFLESLYPDRKDMSGLFLSGDKIDPQRPGTLESRYDREARRPWIIVPFNAWLNQHVDPPWWSFYQTIRKACFSAIKKEGCPGIVFDGNGPYEMKRESRFHRFDRWRGLWVRELLWRFWTPKVQNAFITLGFVLLAFVLLLGLGLFDLKVLASFFKDGKLPEGTSALGGAAKFLITSLTILMGGASAAWSMFATFTQTLLPGTPEAAKNYSLGSADPLSRFRKHFADMMEAVERPVLVIIDDIDRCEPKFIVEMTRGLQTILKSPRVVYLLLGDKNWIEQAFEVCHKDMKEINVGPEHTFGGRFVEKAIQLSYVLPDMGEKLEDYVSTVLIGRVVQQQEADAAEEPQDESGGGTTTRGNASDDQGEPERKDDRQTARTEPEIDPELLRSITDTISKGHTLEDIDRLASVTIENIRQSAPRANRKEAERAVRDAVILQRSTRREAVEEAIRHRLQPIGHFLPGNPRHIKRIINAISMYQNSLVAFEAQQEDRKVGGKRWRQLVVGVVLMIGYPKSWGILAKNPDWAEYLIAGETKLPGSEGTGGAADEAYASLVRNTVFATLMKDAKLTDENGAPVKTEIDKDAVEWLNKIIPVAGG